MSLSRVDRVVEKLKQDVLEVTQKTYPPGMTENEIAAAKEKEYEEAFEQCQLLTVRFSGEELRELSDRLNDIAARLRMQAGRWWRRRKLKARNSMESPKGFFKLLRADPRRVHQSVCEKVS